VETYSRFGDPPVYFSRHPVNRSRRFSETSAHFPTSHFRRQQSWYCHRGSAISYL